MALKIRLQRGGARNNPHYRIVVTESSNPRDGRFVERIGSYDPRNKDVAQQELLNLERAEYWMRCGAKPSETVGSLIKRAQKKRTVEVAQA